MTCKNRILHILADSRESNPLKAILPHPLGTWYFRIRERRALREAEPKLLADAGISLADALAEAAKPFWRC